MRVLKVSIATILVILVNVFGLFGQGSLLNGTPIGTGTPYSAGRGYEKATDGNTTTYVDVTPGDGTYTGIDLGSGNAKVISKIRYWPRTNQESRMNGGKFQGSTTSSSSGYTDLYTISSNPSTGQFTERTISNPTAYRYLRYLSPNNGYCNVMEIEFYGSGGNSAPEITSGARFFQAWADIGVVNNTGDAIENGISSGQILENNNPQVISFNIATPSQLPEGKHLRAVY